MEDAFSANGRIELVEHNSVTSTLRSPFVSSATLPGVLDEMMSELLGAVTGATVRVGAETAFIGIASRGVEDGQRGASPAP